jgi:hypothetical protein
MSVVVGCSHTVGDCTHVNDLRPVPRPAKLTMLNPTGGVGQGLTAEVASLVAGEETSRHLTIIWRSCTALDQLSANETASTVTVTVDVSGCPLGNGESTEGAQGVDSWFGGVVQLAQLLGTRTVVSVTPVFCDVVKH